MTAITISVAPNGARKTQKDLPQIPISPDELAKEAVACAAAGASLFHLHVRNDDQGHSLDVDRYRAALSAIRHAVGDQMVLQVTTETVGIYSPPDMISVVTQLHPESASIGIRELIPSAEYAPDAQIFLHWAISSQILIQYICYSVDDVIYLHSLREQGIVPKNTPLFVLYVLGKKTGEAAVPEELPPFIAAHERLFPNIDLHWSVCAFGGQELECMRLAAAHNGHVRIGFENNHLLASGTIADSNAALISQFVTTITTDPKTQHRSIGSAAELRNRYLA